MGGVRKDTKGLAVALLLLTAFGSLSGCSQASDQGEPTISAELSEWSLEVAPERIPAGSIDIGVANDGILMHELIVVETPDPTEPFSTVNGVVDISRISGEVIAEVAELSPSDDIRATLELDEGTYVFFCNIPGHYEAGMHAVVEVGG